MEISSVTGQPPSWDRSHFSPPRVVAKSHQRDKRCRFSSQRPQCPALYRCFKRKLGHSLRAKLYKTAVVKLGKKVTHKCSRVEGGFSGLSKSQGPVSKPNCVRCNGQLNSGSLHKQTRRNSLSRDVCSSVEDHDLVPSLPDNCKNQTHSSTSECGGRRSIRLDQV